MAIAAARYEASRHVRSARGRFCRGGGSMPTPAWPVDRAFSASGTAPARLGAGGAGLGHDIAAPVRDTAPDGRPAEAIESGAPVARNPGKEATA